MTVVRMLLQIYTRRAASPTARRERLCKNRAGMKSVTTRQGILLLGILLTVIVVWPPDSGRSLAATLVNWAVDPRGQLPVLPPQLGYGVGDDPAAVEERDAIVRRYDALNGGGWWMRTRLRLKVAGDPFAPSTERQLLLALGAVAAFFVWRNSPTARS